VIARALALLVLVVASRPTLGAAQIVGVASDDASGSLARRLSAELRARGYDTRDLSRADAETPTDVLDALAWAHDEPASVRVCVTAAPGRAPGCETLDDADATLLSLRAVELVRAHLGDPHPRAATIEPEAPDPVAPPRPSRSRADAWSLSLAFALAPPIDALSTSLGVSGGLAWSPDPWLELEVGGFVSALDARVDDPAGGASFAARALWLGGGLRVPPEVLGGHRIVIGGGVSLAGAEVHARATTPLEARDTAFVTALLFARVATVLRLAPRIGLLLAVRVGGSLPRPSFVFDAREVARWGAPFVLAEAGLTIDLAE
jgi:hypothetical protein